MNEMLELVINTLNQVEVKGEDNLNKLLSSILALKNLVRWEDDNGNTDGENDS